MKAKLTSAGFLGLEAGVPGLLPYLLEEKEVEGPVCEKQKVLDFTFTLGTRFELSRNQINCFSQTNAWDRPCLKEAVLTLIIRAVTAA